MSEEEKTQKKETRRLSGISAAELTKFAPLQSIVEEEPQPRHRRRSSLEEVRTKFNKMELRPSTPDFENDHSSDNSERFEWFEWNLLVWFENWSIFLPHS